jgi:hypothetical protein
LRHRSPLPPLLFTAVLATIVSLPALASAHSLVGFNNENRTVLALGVGQARLRSWVPAPWQLNPVASGSSKLWIA